MARESLDLRLGPAAIGAWLTAAWGLGWTLQRAVIGAAILVLAGGCAGWASKRQHAGRVSMRVGMTTRFPSALAAALILAGAALLCSALRGQVAEAGPIPSLARQDASVSVIATVTSDPVTRAGRFEPYVLVRLEVSAVEGEGVRSDVRSAILVIGETTWSALELGERIEATGRLGVAESDDLAAVMNASSGPRVIGRAAWWMRGVGVLRTGIAEEAAPLAAPEQALLPALVDGDDSTMPDGIRSDFQTTGLTHVLAVSGSNLTLVLSFALFVARWCRVRGRWLAVVGLGCVVFFVLLARPQPSVLRAAAMGVVALGGLTAGGRQRGVRTLCVAVVALVMLDPWLARSVGFVLSTLATAGILLLGPPWRAALGRWLPPIVADALAVPLAAQVVCTPVIAVVSGSVSLVAVAANLVAAPAVGPATVFALVAGILCVVSTTVGHLVGRVAGLPAWWIVMVAERGSAFNGASVGVPVGPLAITALTLICIAVTCMLPAVLKRRGASIGVACVLIVIVIHPLGRLGWPPSGWLLVACDVGQGDGLVLNAGDGLAVVVDAGPDPTLIDSCLDDLHVSTIPLVVLTHFHADHVDGLAGVLDGRNVGEIEVSPYSEPPEGVALVSSLAKAAGIPVTVAVAGEKRQIGNLSWTVLGPIQIPPAGADENGSDGSGPNNASIVMKVSVDGHSILMSGDAEPEEQDDILRTAGNLSVDVLKVAHHGSARTDPAYVDATHASIAIISVGADNPYGHPAASAIAMLVAMGARVYRTDQDGDIAVVNKLGQLAVVASQ